jgi:hypothetical protein
MTGEILHRRTAPDAMVAPSLERLRFQTESK